MFSFLEAIKELEVSGGNPGKRYLNRDVNGHFFAQDERLGSMAAAALHNEMLEAITDELWFAHRHLPFAQQWSLHHESAALAAVLLWKVTKQVGLITLESASEVAAGISEAIRYQTPEALNAHWMGLANSHGKMSKSFLEEARNAQDKWRIFRVSRLCEFLPRAIGVAFGAHECVDRKTAPARSRKDVEAIVAQAMMCQSSYMSTLVGLLLTAHGDATVSDHVLDLASRLSAFGTTPEETEALDTMSVALLVSLAPKALRKMVVSREQLDWIRLQVFILGGHLKAIDDLRAGEFRMDRTGTSLAPFAAPRLLKLGKQYLGSAVGVEVVQTLLSATAILEANIGEEEARIEKLVMIESRLRLADPLSASKARCSTSCWTSSSRAR